MNPATHLPTPEQPLLSESQLATALSVSERTLRDWRQRRKGPAFVKLGGLIRYRGEDVAVWLVANRRSVRGGLRDASGALPADALELLRAAVAPIVRELMEGRQAA